MRWIWIDRFVEFHSGKSARAVKNLSLAEDHFADHFPGYPVMPARSDSGRTWPRPAAFSSARRTSSRKRSCWPRCPGAIFHREMLAGEQLIYEVEIQHLRPEGASVERPRTASTAQ